MIVEKCLKAIKIIKEVTNRGSGNAAWFQLLIELEQIGSAYISSMIRYCEIYQVTVTPGLYPLDWTFTVVDPVEQNFIDGYKLSYLLDDVRVRVSPFTIPPDLTGESLEIMTELSVATHYGSPKILRLVMDTQYATVTTNWQRVRLHRHNTSFGGGDAEMIAMVKGSYPLIQWTNDGSIKFVEVTANVSAIFGGNNRGVTIGILRNTSFMATGYGEVNTDHGSRQQIRAVTQFPIVKDDTVYVEARLSEASSGFQFHSTSGLLMIKGWK